MDFFYKGMYYPTSDMHKFPLKKRGNTSFERSGCRLVKDNPGLSIRIIEIQFITVNPDIG